MQLLRAGLFPVTSEHPQAATTFRTLELFELLSYKSKVSAYEYYQMLSRLTDNTGMKTPPVRHMNHVPILAGVNPSHQQDWYASFGCSIRIWWHLKMLKRSGRGHDPAGVVNMQEGDCALHCPACPQPGMNLPNGWEAAGDDKQSGSLLFVSTSALTVLLRVGGCIHYSWLWTQTSA